MRRQYLCIDLKSFYASVECVDRGLDPLATRAVVADLTRTDKTICLAVSPALKALGVPGRCRVFEIPAGIDYEAFPPRMARYIEKSADVYSVYLKYLSKDDLFAYSVDEAFMDVTPYLTLYGCTARELGERIRADVVATTGIPAACGLGTNLYLAKVALDITAKHSADFFGELDEEAYRSTLWNHRPITDFWRVGPGTARRLAGLGITSMGQLAAAPTEPIYRAMGVDAEILIDHAWGVEPLTIADVRAYRPRTHSLSSGQVFGCDYSFDDALLVAKEMADQLTLELVDRDLVAQGVSLSVGHRLEGEERAALRATASPGDRRAAFGEATDGGSVRLASPTSSSTVVRTEITRLFEERVSRRRPVHRLGIALTDVLPADEAGTQLDLFCDQDARERETRRQRAVNAVRHKYGKNSLLRAMDLLPAATARERNRQIGGHRGGE